MSTDTAKTIYILDNIRAAYSDRGGIQKSLYTEDQKGSMRSGPPHEKEMKSLWWFQINPLRHFLLVSGVATALTLFSAPLFDSKQL